MRGKTVILAGGSGGIGAALADWVASRGAIPVIGCLRNTERAGALAARLRSKYGVPAPVVPGDVVEDAPRRELIDAATSEGPLYGLVPLIGEPARVPIEEATADDFLGSMRTNFVAPMLLSRDFASRVRGNDASIVHGGLTLRK